MEFTKTAKMFRIHFLDVGRGDAIILQFANGRTYLVDSNEVEGKIIPLAYLTRTLGIIELETIVVTHPHRDHFRGLQKINEPLPRLSTNLFHIFKDFLRYDILPLLEGAGALEHWGKSSNAPFPQCSNARFSLIRFQFPSSQIV